MQSQKGMWRRVDELGRVVIPKEIRVFLNVKPGDVIEFCSTADNSVLLRKYHRIDDITDIASICTYACNNIQDAILCIASSQHIIASTNRNFLNINIDTNNKYYLDNLQPQILDILSNKTPFSFPIIANGDQHGVVLLYTGTSQQNTNISIAKFVVNLLSKYLER